MWKFLRRKLGYYAVGEDLATINGNIQRLERRIEVHNAMVLKALAQIISTVNPNYHKPEVEPMAEASQQVKDDWAERKAESDRIGEAALNRMNAEQAAADKHNRRV